MVSELLARPGILARNVTLQARCRDAAFIAGWEIQSHLSSIALVALLSFGSFTSLFPIMLLWALVATVVYHRARLDGRPDLLERTTFHSGSTLVRVRLMGAAWSLIKAWLAGIQAFIYSRMLGRFLQNDCKSWEARIAKVMVLALGLTIFGVPTAHHLLRRAGYEQDVLLRMGFLAACLHVSYRVIAGALVVNLTLGVDMPLP